MNQVTTKNPVKDSVYQDLQDELLRTQEQLKDVEAYVSILQENFESADQRRRKHFKTLDLLKQQYRRTSHRLGMVRDLLRSANEDDVARTRLLHNQYLLAKEGVKSLRNRRNRRVGLALRATLQQAVAEVPK